MEDSILTSIKKMLGITEDYEHFDKDIILCINSVFSILTQLGVGPKTGFCIVDNTTKWGGYLGQDGRLDMVKSFMYLRVRLMFDPPQNGPMTDALERQAKELEWRILIAADQTEIDIPDLPDNTSGLQFPFSNSPINRDTLVFDAGAV